MKNAKLGFSLLAAAFAWVAGGAAQAQEILLDKGVKAGPLQVFQDLKDPKAFYYVPDQARLAVGPDGKQEFSFLKYVTNVKSKPGEDATDRSEGGGIVHCLVQLGPTPEQISEARAELRRLVPGAELKGPIIFRSGKFAIISNFKQENGDLALKVLGLGNAPVLDGEKAAVSMRLTTLGAQLLWESFKTAAPDISFTFEMEMQGYRNPYDATLIAEFDQIYKHRSMSLGAQGSFGPVVLGAQIRDTFDELRSTGAIKLTTRGDDPKIDALIATAYGKICEMMFDKMDSGASSGGIPGLPGQGSSETDLINTAGQMLKDTRADVRAENQAQAQALAASAPGAGGQAPGGQGAGGQAPGGQANEAPDPRFASPLLSKRDSEELRARREGTARARAEPSFAVLASYTQKTVRRSGRFELSFNKFTTDTLQLRFDQNIGNLTPLMSDKTHFAEVNLDDPLFQKREIMVVLDASASDFKDYINYVTVRLRKKHQGGDFTNDEVRIDRDNFNKSANNFKLLYGTKNDPDRNRWMEYEYNTVWSFFGGKEVDQGWKQGRSANLTAAPPYTRRVLQVEANPTPLQEKGVRLVTVKVFYKDPAGAEQMKQVTLNPAGGQLSLTVDYIRPRDQMDYAYEVSWRMQDGSTRTSGRKPTTDDFILADTM